MYRFTFIIFIFILSNQIATGQSLTGLSGLLNVPDATVSEDGRITTGLNFINKEYLSYSNQKHHIVTPYVSINYLPFVEFGFRLNRQFYKYDKDKHHTADRMVSARIQFMKEKKYLPALLVGGHDIFSSIDEATTKHFNATYIVTSKHLNIKKLKLGFHAGYGVDWIKARHRQLTGFFGGTSICYKNTYELLFEYDTQTINVGCKILFFNKLMILIGVQDFRAISGGLSYTFLLPKKIMNKK